MTKIQAFIDPATVLFMFVLSFLFEVVCGLFKWKRTCADLLSFVYFYIVL